MHHRLLRLHALVFSQRHIWSEEFIALLLVAFIFVIPVSASTRLQERSLFTASAVGGERTSYTVSYRYVTPAAVGSVDMLFCIDPIPHHPCVVPPGLDVSSAVLNEQLGDIGFSISQRSTNHLLLTRTPTVPSATGKSSYTFDNIRNPDNTDQSFAIRLRTHSSTNATGPQIDFGSVKGQMTDSITIETQVPPMLIFCVAEIVDNDCTVSNENYYTDMGNLTPTDTLTAQSQMMVGTNASGGFAITAVGDPPAAGTNVIDSPSSPTVSRLGTNQFGINLVENTLPAVGLNPEGTWANAVPSPDYAVPNQYKYISGDIVAFSPNVSLMKKFTVSYILNSSPSLRAGAYSTTINYIASGRF